LLNIGRGHLVHECPEKRWSKYVPSNPTICSYENPRQFLNNLTSNGKSSVSISEDQSKVLPFSISAIDINHVSREGKHMHRHIPVNMTEKEKLNLGKLLAKLEFKHRVQINSCYVGKKWEVTIHKRPNGHPLSAVNSIVRYLDASSTGPGVA
jgi:hypothetical protein